MCIHKRTLYACNHHIWGPPVRPCSTARPQTSVTPTTPASIISSSNASNRLILVCGHRTTHPLHSIRVSSLCSACAAAKAHTQAVITELRTKLHALGEVVEGLAQSGGKKSREELEKEKVERREREWKRGEVERGIRRERAERVEWWRWEKAQMGGGNVEEGVKWETVRWDEERGNREVNKS